MAKKPFKEYFKNLWKEFDFVLLTKLTLGDMWREFKCSLRGEPMPPKTTQEKYLELLNAKRNSKN